MDLELDQDQHMLAKTVADFAKNESPVGRFRKLRDDDVGYDPAVWRKMGELGWMGIPFSESVGGFGGSFVECAIVLENLATTLVPEPYLASVVLGGMTLARAGNAAQHEAYLTPMIEGETTLALAYSEPQSRYDVGAVETTAAPNGAGYRLSGKKAWVLNGHRADHLIVSAKAPNGVTLFVVPRDAEGVNMTVAKTIDGQKAAFIELDSVAVAEEAPTPGGRHVRRDGVASFDFNGLDGSRGRGRRRHSPRRHFGGEGSARDRWHLGRPAVVAAARRHRRH